MIGPMIPRLVLLLLAALTTAAFADPHQERRWTGINGKTFTGAYMGTDKKTGKYSFALEGGKTYLIDPKNLSEQDLEWLDFELHPEKEPKPNATDPDAFLPDPKFDRTVFPTINQSDYGSKASDCVPSSFCNFVLWWDMEGYLPIDKRGGFDKKAEYIHSRMARYFKTRNTAGTDLRDAKEGAKAYFEKEVSELATVRVLSDYNCDPDNLRRYTTGPNATLLGVSVYYGRKAEGGHVVALSQVEDNGDLVIYTWGARIRGRLKVIEKDLRLPMATTSKTGHKYEIEFMNKGDLPEWMIDYEVRFEIDPGSWDGLMVISPYRYKTPGAGLPPPPDPLMEPTQTRQYAPGTVVTPLHPNPEVTTLAPPKFPYHFKKASRFDHDWTLTDGTTLTGPIASCGDQSITIAVDQKRHSHSLTDFVPADRARGYLWRGITDPPPRLTEGRFDYLLTRIRGGSEFTFPAHILLSGDRFRIDMPSLKPKRSIIGDIKTCEFLVRWDKDKHYIGRLAAKTMLPIPPSGTDLSTWEKLRDDVPDAARGTHPDWPCRLISMKSPPPDHRRIPHIMRLKDPVMLFSAIEAPTLTTALQFLLAPESVARENEGSKSSRLGIFRGTGLASGHPVDDLLGFCHQAHLAPIRLQWVNTYDPRSSIARYLQPKAGTFRLELTSLDLTPQSAALFEIPAEAATVAVDRHRVVHQRK